MPRMLHSDYLGAETVPCLDLLADPSVQVWVPDKGWVKQTEKTKRVTVPLTLVHYDQLKAWLYDRLAQLPETGVVVLMHRAIQHATTQVGLFHDERTEIYESGEHPLNTHLGENPLGMYLERDLILERFIEIQRWVETFGELSIPAKNLAQPLVLKWPEGAEVVEGNKHKDVMLGNRRVARIFEGVHNRERSSLLFHIYSGFRIAPMNGVFQVVASDPVFETYTVDDVRYGSCTYERVTYSTSGWDKNSAWVNLSKRYEGRFESNPWKKEHTETSWCWSRRLEIGV